MPTLNFTYSGPAYRARKVGDEWKAVKTETIFGSFRVLRQEEGRIVLGNGDQPDEGVWVVNVPVEVAV